MHVVVKGSAYGQENIASQMCYPDPLLNGDFMISGNSEDQPVGNGVNEVTKWSYDFTNNADFADLHLESKSLLDVAQLKLHLIPKDRYISTDTVQVKGLTPIRLAKITDPTRLYIDKPTTVDVDLLFYYGKDQIVKILSQGEDLPILYEDDALIYQADVLLEQWDRMYLNKLEGSGLMASPQQWKARATVVICDAGGNGVEGVHFQAKWSECHTHQIQGIGTWYEFLTRPVKGVTDRDGRCILKSPVMENTIKQVQFSIASNTITHSEYLYDADSHLDPDARPVSTISIKQPQPL